MMSCRQQEGGREVEKGVRGKRGGGRIENGIDSWRADETDIRETEDRLKLDKGSSRIIDLEADEELRGS